VALCKEGCSMNELITDFIAQGKFFDARNEIVKMNVVDIAQLLHKN